ncbi:MAG: hypothetical protein ACI957_005360 [Verrucomicrobiales bacterium]|jgi:hypothetical protein
MLSAYASAHWLHGHLGSRWRMVMEGFLGSLRVPITVASLQSSMQLASETVQSNSFLHRARGIVTGLRVIWPVALIAIPFIILLGGGNAVLQSTFSQWTRQFLESLRDFEPPTPGRLCFWIGTAFLSLGLLSRTPASKWMDQLENKIPDRFRCPTETRLSIYRTWLLLAVVNLIFIIANSADAWFLWSGAGRPQGVTPSDFVHQGVHRIIACVILAAVVLSLVFHQAKEVVQTHGVKALAYAWIVQNFVLTGSVILRLKLYVDTFQLSLLRLHVLCFLLLVATGFVLLVIKIKRDHGFAWLLNANCLAVFGLFFIMQFVNDRGLVAHVNYSMALQNPNHTLDVDYLAALGSPAWPTLHRITRDPQQFPNSSQLAAKRLSKARAADQYASRTWQSWQWRHAQSRKRITPGSVVASGPQWRVRQP